MHVAVGSANPVKREATARVLDGDVDAVPVGSGVSEQPTGHVETRRGARVRSRRALESGASGEYDLGVGIEGGVARFADGAVTGRTVDDSARVDEDASADGTSVDDGRAVAGDDLYLVMWAAVTDGERLELGAGPSLVLPDRIASRVRAGEELGPVMDDVLGTDDVARNEGAAGAFTGGRLTRADALETAVTAAAGPWLSDLY